MDTKVLLNDVILLRPRLHHDDRGYFFESYNRRHFSKIGIASEFVQDNQSGSSLGVLRGLHYQVRHPQGKLVRVISGEVFDVAVDLRRSSETFGEWVCQRLSAENKNMLWIPPGFAHGFYTLSDWAELQYKVTDYYAPEYDRTLLWNDPEVGVEWPLIDNQPPTLSNKDAQGIPLAQAETYK